MVLVACVTRTTGGAIGRNEHHLVAFQSDLMMRFNFNSTVIGGTSGYGTDGSLSGERCRRKNKMPVGPEWSTTLPNRTDTGCPASRYPVACVRRRSGQRGLYGERRRGVRVRLAGGPGRTRGGSQPRQTGVSGKHGQQPNVHRSYVRTLTGKCSGRAGPFPGAPWDSYTIGAPWSCRARTIPTSTCAFAPISGKSGSRTIYLPFGPRCSCTGNI